MCSAASPITPSLASRSCCHGTSPQACNPQGPARWRERFCNAPLPRIAEFIDYGQVTLGDMDPIGGVAITNDGHNTLATLVCKEGETFAQLLIRLDQVIAKSTR